MSEFGPGSNYAADPEQAEVSIQRTNDALGRVDDELDEAVALLEQLEKAFFEAPEEKQKDLHRQITAADDRATALQQEKDEAEQEHSGTSASGTHRSSRTTTSPTTTRTSLCRRGGSRGRIRRIAPVRSVVERRSNDSGRKGRRS